MSRWRKYTKDWISLLVIISRNFRSLTIYVVFTIGAIEGLLEFIKRNHLFHDTNADMEQQTLGEEDHIEQMEKEYFGEPGHQDEEMIP